MGAQGGGINPKQLSAEADAASTRVCVIRAEAAERVCYTDGVKRVSSTRGIHIITYCIM